MRSLDPIAIDALLPQTQCTQCGYSGCLPYAEAIAAGAAAINQCPPGGDEGIRALSALTAILYAPLNSTHGLHKRPLIAVIDEAACIGCTICIQKCPVDAIAGAAKLMHTVIVDECTGCELCVAPCPVDCIAMVPMPATHPALTERAAAANRARNRHRSRAARLERLAQRQRRGRDDPPARQAAIDAGSSIEANTGDNDPATTGAIDRVGGVAVLHAAPAIGSPEHKARAIAAALARAQTRRTATDPS